MDSQLPTSRSNSQQLPVTNVNSQVPSIETREESRLPPSQICKCAIHEMPLINEVEFHVLLSSLLADTKEPSMSGADCCGRERQKKLKGAQLKKLIPVGHGSEEIGNLLVDNAKRLGTKRDMTKQQKRALKKLKVSPEEYNLDKRSPEDILRPDGWAEILDDLYFFGALRSYTEFRFSVEPITTFLGYTHSHRCGLVPGKVFCEIDLNRKFDYANDVPICRCTIVSRITSKLSPTKKREYYLETLLHEMLHAFFAIYCCNCELCHNHVLQFEGVRGHGLSWATAWKAIQENSEAVFRRGFFKRIIGDIEVGIAYDIECHTEECAVQPLPEDLPVFCEQIRRWAPEFEKITKITKLQIEELGANLEYISDRVNDTLLDSLHQTSPEELIQMREVRQLINQEFLTRKDANAKTDLLNWVLRVSTVD